METQTLNETMTLDEFKKWFKSLFSWDTKQIDFVQNDELITSVSTLGNDIYIVTHHGWEKIRTTSYNFNLKDESWVIGYWDWVGTPIPREKLFSIASNSLRLIQERIEKNMSSSYIHDDDAIPKKVNRIIIK